MKDKLIVILACVFAVALVINTYLLLTLQAKLSDCYFECNHLQVRLYRLQELSDYVPAMEQLLPPEVLAQLKAATLMIQRKRWKEYERYEQPLIERR